jgi:hypothetical protein
MKQVLRLISIPLAAAILVAPPAFAQTPGVNLSWDDCGAAGSVDKARANCNTSDTGQQTFFGSFVAPAGITLNAADMFINMVSATPAMPAWWDIGAPPACRAANALAVFYNLPCGSAVEYWGTIPGGPFGGNTYAVNPAPNPNQVPGPNHAALRAVVSVDNLAAQPITAGTEYYAVTVTLRNTASTTCAGCDVAVCMLFNACTLFDPQVTLAGPPTGGRDFITWQGGTGAPCAEVPVHNTTWGQVKSLYR